MVKREERVVMKAVALCYKRYLKPEEAMIYCNLGRTQLAKKLDEYSINKNPNGYYSKTDLDRMLSGAPSMVEQAAQICLKLR